MKKELIKLSQIASIFEKNGNIFAGSIITNSMKKISSVKWTDSQSVYNSIYRNMFNLGKEIINEIYAEWVSDIDGFDADSKKYNLAIKNAKTISKGKLIDYIWGKSYKQAICNIDKSTAWICPYGCHTINFSE
jgi:Fe-S-cluster formation regulator IscX/YfhJ